MQREFATLEAELEQDENDEEADKIRSEKEREALAVERLNNEIAEVRQEIALLKETQQSIADTRQSSSLKAQYEEEKQEIEEDIAHIESVFKDTTTQLHSNSVRLHSLLRTLAPSPTIGTLMTRLHQQLTQGVTKERADDGATKTTRKTVDLQEFLDSCPSAEEGKQAIEEMKKLELIYCYESSGIITLAD
uniref:Uncharacterized protein n=1 Tax=Globisporangium ultimum (strain ATCC 200006 / CBS 805.95 / DAOM BR144) TaxID=431595 RepID=K3X782_GLOUD